MEVASSNLVLVELTRGTELVKKLQAQIENCSVEACRELTKEILYCLGKSVSMVTESARALAESPRSEDSGRDSVVRKGRENMCKKRKTPEKWTTRVRLGTGPGVDGPVDDGYSWRKYGQKEILDAKHPRSYYRCTHRKSQGCLAMKQVQRSEDNPSAFEVTYRAAHTCRPKSAAQAINAAATPRQHNQDLLLSFQTGLRVKTEGLDSKSPEPPTSSSMEHFSFPSTPEAFTFSPSSTTPDNCFVRALVSPATSESNYFSCGMSGYGGGHESLQAAGEWDFGEMVVSSATCPDTNSTMLDMDFVLNSLDLDQDFPFHTCSFPLVN